MRVGMLGGGAMGSLFAGLLAGAGRSVAVLDRNPDHVARLQDPGLRIEGATEWQGRIEADTDPAELGRVDLLFVWVKSHQTADALAGATPLYDEATTVCTLQNGLGNAETVADFLPEENVVAGTTAHGATLESPGRVYHAGRGPTRVGGYFDSAAQHVERVLAALEGAVSVETAADVRDALWEKVLVNVGINAATALARVDNGALTDGPGASVLDRAVWEGARVAAAEGRDVPRDVAARARQVAAATAGNVSSMRADVEAGRHTEIAALNGAVVARGERHGLPTPVNRTLADLVALAAGQEGPDSGGRGQP
jgi:2-dehydropantoate 2-reductase